MTKLADPVADGFSVLSSVLSEQEAGYRALRSLVSARRDAIRVADLEALKHTLDRERTLVSKLASLDGKRTELASALAKRLGLMERQGGRPASVPTLTELLAKAPRDQRERLSEIAERLRDEINAARRESGIVRDAAERLAQHVAGVLQSVSAAFASSKTYGRAGRFATAGAIRSIDIRS
jgi:FlgN protein